MGQPGAGILDDLNREDRSEGFFLEELHGSIYARYYGGLEEIRAEVGAGISTTENLRAEIYGVVDQQIYAEGPRTITIFARPGGAPSNSNFVDYYVDGGFDFTGFVPGRDQDIAGLAVGRSHVSKDFSNAEVAEGNAPFTAETYLEATYKVQLTPWWNIQPDFQYVITPSGEAGSHNATIIGVRTYVLF